MHPDSSSLARLPIPKAECNDEIDAALAGLEEDFNPMPATQAAGQLKKELNGNPRPSSGKSINLYDTFRNIQGAK